MTNPTFCGTIPTMNDTLEENKEIKMRLGVFKVCVVLAVNVLLSVAAVLLLQGVGILGREGDAPGVLFIFLFLVFSIAAGAYSLEVE